MAYGVKYKIPARSIVGDLWRCEISEKDYSGGFGTLKGADSPFTYKIIDNDENKFMPIRASELTIKFISADFDLESIISDSDDKYRVDLIKVDPSNVETLQWRGILSTDDCSEDYISGNRVFTLRAIDGLGLLKNQKNSFGYDRYTLMNIIFQCLDNTHTELPVNFECEVYTDEMSHEPESPFNQCKVHTRLFMYSDAGPQNNYDVLQCILRAFNCTLFQQFGRWHVKRMADEFYGTYGTTREFSDISDLIGQTKSYKWLSERNNDFIPVNASHLLTYIKPAQTSTITHNYVIPEVPANSDLTQGSRYPLLDTAPSGTPATYTHAFLIDLWQLQTGLVSSPVAAGQAFREEKYDADGNLIESWVNVPPKSVVDAGEARLVSLDDPYVDEGDKLTLSGETKPRNTLLSVIGYPAVRIRIYGDSGQDWTWDATTNEWVATLENGEGSSAFTATLDGSGAASAAWQPFDIETKPFPEGGRLQIWFVNWDTRPSNDSVIFHNISIGIKLFRGQVVQDFKGERSTASSDVTSRKTNDVSIQLGDAAKRIVASALWKDVFPTLLVSPKWHRRTDADYEVRLIQLNAIDEQLGSWRVMKKLEGDWYGIKCGLNGGTLLGPGNVFKIDGIKWVASNIEMDLINNQWRGVLNELYDETKDATFSIYSTTFKYLFGNERN